VARNKPKAREPGSIADTVARLALWASRPGRGFARVEYHSEFSRSEVDRQLGETLRNRKVPYHWIELPVGRPPSDVMRTLLERLEQLEPAVVSITGFATAVPDALRRDFLGYLTWNRENLTACNHRQIWWMTPDFVDAFIHTVPDLDSWFMVRLHLTEEFTPQAEGRHRFEEPKREGPRYRLDEALRRAASLVERFRRAKETGAEPAELLDLAASAADAIIEVRAPNLTRGLADQLVSEANEVFRGPVSGIHPALRSVIGLSRLLRDQGRMNEAESLVRRVLAIVERIRGLDHPDVARGLIDLATLLQDTNRLAEAEPLLRRALAIDERAYGADHPRVGSDLSHLAHLLRDTGRLGEAEPLLRRSLAIAEQSLGPEHPNVASALDNLAQLLRAENRLAEAEALTRRALAIDEPTYGPDHPRVAIRLNNLALLLEATNRLGEAEPLLRRALAIDEPRFGPDHPEVATDLNNLAELLRATNRLDEAEPLYRRALAIDERAYGPDDPSVATVLNNLALLLQATDRLGEAEPLSRRHLEILLKFTHSTGHEHPHLRAAIDNYTSLLEDMGQSPAQIRTRLDEIGRPFGMSPSDLIERHPG
jgi:tetratricopeptide (TPR) repeat protein